MLARVTVRCPSFCKVEISRTAHTYSEYGTLSCRESFAWHRATHTREHSTCGTTCSTREPGSATCWRARAARQAHAVRSQRAGALRRASPASAYGTDRANVSGWRPLQRRDAGSHAGMASQRESRICGLAAHRSDRIDRTADSTTLPKSARAPLLTDIFCARVRRGPGRPSVSGEREGEGAGMGSDPWSAHCEIARSRGHRHRAERRGRRRAAHAHARVHDSLWSSKKGSDRLRFT